MIHEPPAAGNTRADEIRDAAWNAVAVASLAYQQEIIALSRVLACAQGHGLTVDDLVYASGLDAALVTRLLGEAG